MANAVSEWTTPIAEQSTPTYRARLIDGESGEGLDPSAVTSAVVTLSVGSVLGGVINNRDSQSIRNEHGGEFLADGWFVMRLSSLDTVAVGPAPIQRRWMTFKIVYNGGVITHKVVFYVRNLAHIPEAP